LEHGSEEDTAAIDVSDFQDDVCDEQDDMAPVQPPLTDGNGMLLEEPEGAPQNGHSSSYTALLGKPGKPAVAPLNRKERRARQRMLERKLRKAR